VLVDCIVDAPSLSHAGQAEGEEGLVDAFEYGASLNRIVQQQPQADLFFIPAGTYAPSAEPVLSNPRWRRLSAGFRHEEALLLLYVGAEHLKTTPADPDGMVVLAPQGRGLSASEAPALMDAVAGGLPLLAVVADERSLQQNMPAPAFEPEAPPVMAVRSSRPILHARVAAIVAAMFLAVLAFGAAQYFGGPDLLRRMRSAGPDADPAVAPSQTSSNPNAPSSGALNPTATSSTAAAAPATNAVRVVLPPVESLPFALDVAIVPELEGALAAADSLEAHGARTIVAPFHLKGRPTRYHVQAGPFATRARADSVRAALFAQGVLPRGAGRVARVPMSVAFSDRLGRTAALAERARLRRLGVPTFVLGQADGSFRLYAGSFDRPLSMLALTEMLPSIGSAGAIVPRAGYVP